MARGLTFSTAIQARGARHHQGPGHFLALLAAGVRVSFSLFLSLLLAFESSPSFFPKCASFFSFLFHLQRREVEAVSAPVRVFINTHGHTSTESGSEAPSDPSRYDVLGTSFGSLLSLLYRVTSFKCALPRKTGIYFRKMFDKPHYFHHFTSFPSLLNIIGY